MRNTSMKVTALLTRAIAVGAAAAALTVLIPGTSAFAADQKQQVSPKLAKPLHDAQEDLKNHKYTEAIAKLKEADASPAKTNNFDAAAKAWGAELDDGFTSQADIAQKTKEVSTFYYQAKNYDKAIE